MVLTAEYTWSETEENVSFRVVFKTIKTPILLSRLNVYISSKHVQIIHKNELFAKTLPFEIYDETSRKHHVYFESQNVVKLNLTKKIATFWHTTAGGTRFENTRLHMLDLEHNRQLELSTAAVSKDKTNCLSEELERALEAEKRNWVAQSRDAISRNAINEIFENELKDTDVYIEAGTEGGGLKRHLEEEVSAPETLIQASSPARVEDGKTREIRVCSYMSHVKEAQQLHDKAVDDIGRKCLSQSLLNLTNGIALLSQPGEQTKEESCICLCARLYCNRSLVNLLLGNITSAVHDCERSLETTCNMSDTVARERIESVLAARLLVARVWSGTYHRLEADSPAVIKKFNRNINLSDEGRGNECLHLVPYWSDCETIHRLACVRTQTIANFIEDPKLLSNASICQARSEYFLEKHSFEECSKDLLRTAKCVAQCSAIHVTRRTDLNTEVLGIIEVPPTHPLKVAQIWIQKRYISITWALKFAKMQKFGNTYTDTQPNSAVDVCAQEFADLMTHAAYYLHNASYYVSILIYSAVMQRVFCMSSQLEGSQILKKVVLRCLANCSLCAIKICWWTAAARCCWMVVNALGQGDLNTDTGVSSVVVHEHEDRMLAFLNYANSHQMYYVGCCSDALYERMLLICKFRMDIIKEAQRA